VVVGRGGAAAAAAVVEWMRMLMRMLMRVLLREVVHISCVNKVMMILMMM